MAERYKHRTAEGLRASIGRRSLDRIGDTAEEACHVAVCNACGQAFDMRDLNAAFYHEVEGHRPLEHDA